MRDSRRAPEVGFGEITIDVSEARLSVLTVWTEEQLDAHHAS